MMFQIKFVEKIKTHFMFSNPPPEIRAVYEMMWKNIVQPYMPQMTIWRMRTECWIPKAINTHSEYVILIAVYSHNGYANAPQYYVILTWPVFIFILSSSCSFPRILYSTLNGKG